MHEMTCHLMKVFPVVIGIGGASTAGKTSLSKALTDFFSKSDERGSQMIGQDKFFKEKKPSITFDNIHFNNWEVPEAINFENFIKAIQNKREEMAIQISPETLNSYRRPFLFVEGFLIFAKDEVEKLFDQKIFVSIPRETCYQRRLDLNSKWTQPEPNFEPYFKYIVWPSYIQNNKHCTGIKDLFVIDGKNSQEQIFEEAKTYLTSNIPSNLSTGRALLESDINT